MLLKWLGRLIGFDPNRRRAKYLYETFHNKDSSLHERVLAGLELITGASKYGILLNLTLRGKLTTYFGSLKIIKEGIKFILHDHRMFIDFGMSLTDTPVDYKRQYRRTEYLDAYFQTYNERQILIEYEEILSILLDNETLFDVESPEYHSMINRLSPLFRELQEVMESQIATQPL